MRLAPTALLLGLTLTSCATTSAPPLPALTMLSVEEVEYDYQLGGQSPEFDVSFDAPDGEALGGIPLVNIEAKMFVVDHESSDVFDPERPLGSAFLTTREDAERFAAEAENTSRATLANSQELCCYEGQHAYVSILNETAYISSFEMNQAEYAAIADPVVDVLKDGILLRVVAPSITEESVAVEASLLVSNTIKPIPVVEWVPFEGVSPVTIQRPLVATQKLDFDAELSRDQVLVLKCENSFDTKTRILIFVSALRFGSDPFADEN